MVLKRGFPRHVEIYIADKADTKKMERFLYSVQNTALCYFCCFNVRLVFVYCQFLSRNEIPLLGRSIL